MSKGGNICFVAGTLVVTATEHVGIENMERKDQLEFMDRTENRKCGLRIKMRHI